MLPEQEKPSIAATPPDRAPGDWIDQLLYTLSGTQQAAESRLATTLQCKIVGDDLCLLVPPELAEYQPEILEYLHSFASTNTLTLIEDRRNLALAPIIDRRQKNSPEIAMALSSLLKNRLCKTDQNGRRSKRAIPKGCDYPKAIYTSTIDARR